MERIHLSELIADIRRSCPLPQDAERMVRFIILEMIMLAVMLGLFARPSGEPGSGTPCTDYSPPRCRPKAILSHAAGTLQPADRTGRFLFR
jgi:hypothetical protein